MQDAIRSQLRKLQHQLDEAAHALEHLGGSSERSMHQRWKRVSRRTTEMGREAGELAQRHPAVSSLLVVGVIALAAACYFHKHDR
jgi:hypothetical protein